VETNIYGVSNTLLELLRVRKATQPNITFIREKEKMSRSFMSKKIIMWAEHARGGGGGLRTAIHFCTVTTILGPPLWSCGQSS
jgi:hypothetical protein